MAKDKKTIAGLRTELEEAKKQAEEYLNGWKRAKADYINREKEIAREKEEWAKFANQSLILEILPVYDNLKKAISQIKDRKAEAWTEGIINIKKQFENILKNLGIEEIKTVGEKFNPELHEAIAGEQKKGAVAEEVSPGYKMHGKVIKPAKVIVN